MTAQVCRLLDEHAPQPGRDAGLAAGGVRVELQADCLAGLWAGGAAGDTSGAVDLGDISQEELDQALDAASAIGDDRIQETTQGRVSPENFTHGASAQRHDLCAAAPPLLTGTTRRPAAVPGSRAAGPAPDRPAPR